MARITSLSIYAQNGSDKEYLQEKYGAVIANIQTKNISNELKNKDLSGSPDAGTVEAKRFVNAQVADYGTARSAGHGSYVKAKPVVIQIDNDKELIEEVEDKDCAMYGVEGLIDRRVANHEQRIGKQLEKAFFAEACTNGTQKNYQGTTKQRVNAAILYLEDLKNDFVDGIDRDYMTLVCKPSIYEDLREEIDTLANPNVNTAAKEIELYHGVKVRKSTDLPVGYEFLVYVDGAVAQPVRFTISPLEKIQQSNAWSFGMFYSYGTKAVAPDTIVAVAANSTDLKSLEIGELTLTPEFDADTTAYTATATKATTAKVEVEAKDASATVVIKNGDTVIENGATVTWAEGANTITVAVTSASKTNTYTVVVTAS